MNNRNILMAAVMLMLNACAVGPDYVRPQDQAPSEWLETIPSAGDASVTGLLDEWWRGFDDPVLEQYVIRALEANHDVLISQARLREVRARRVQARSILFPQVNTSASYTSFTVSKSAPTSDSQAIQAGLTNRSDDFYETGFDASWELDIFGGNRRQAEAAGARVAAAAAQVEAVRLSVVAEVVRSFIELRGLQRRVAVARSNAELQRQSLDVVQGRVASGLAPELDVLRAESQLEATLSAIPQLEAAVRAVIYGLGVLADRPLEQGLTDLAPVASIPSHSQSLEPGLPGEMLKRRPDIRAAERTLAAATADIGIARSELFPKFVLTGMLGLQSEMLSNLTDGDSRQAGFVPFVRWPLFAGGRLQAEVDAASARHQAQLAAYRQTVITAIQEAETALASYIRAERSRQHLRDASRASAEAADIARRLYDTGLTDFLAVLDADRRRLETEDSFIQRQTESGVALVGVYKALRAY